MRAEIDRAAIEGWIDSSTRVFCVYVATRGERIALSGKVVRADDKGIVLVTAHDREGRGSFAMYEQIETLHVGGAKVTTETREVATEPPKPAGLLRFAEHGVDLDGDAVHKVLHKAGVLE